MEKTKVIMKIESYSSKDGNLLLSVNDISVRTMIKSVVSLCEDKYNGYIKLEMCPPYKPRTTGPNSQNSLIWALIQQISKETGNEVDDVEEYAKMRAIKRGYPVKENLLLHQMRPVSMTTITTVEAGYLIEELYQIASEMGIELDA